MFDAAVPARSYVVWLGDMGGVELAVCGTLRSLCSSVSIPNENLRKDASLFEVLGGGDTKRSTEEWI